MKKYIPALIFLIIFIPSVIIYYKYSTGKTDKILEKLNKEYPAISIEESVDGFVTSIRNGDPEVFNNDPHHAYIVLDDSVKKRIRVGYELTKELKLDDILTIGELLIKKTGSDKLFLYKIENQDTIKYVFELRDDLGYPLQKKK